MCVHAFDAKAACGGELSVQVNNNPQLSQTFGNSQPAEKLLAEDWLILSWKKKNDSSKGQDSRQDGVLLPFLDLHKIHEAWLCVYPGYKHVSVALLRTVRSELGSTPGLYWSLQLHQVYFDSSSSQLFIAESRLTDLIWQDSALLSHVRVTGVTGQKGGQRQLEWCAVRHLRKTEGRHFPRLLQSAAQLQGLQRLSHMQPHVLCPWCQKVALAAAALSPVWRWMMKYLLQCGW